MTVQAIANRAPLVPFIRRHLNVRGVTQHNGRGAYECSVAVGSFHLLYEKLSEKLPIWAAEGVVTEFKITPDRIDAVFDKNRFGNRYNKLTLEYDAFNRRSAYYINF
jgi:hypothetical protein